MTGITLSGVCFVSIHRSDRQAPRAYDSRVDNVEVFHLADSWYLVKHGSLPRYSNTLTMVYHRPHDYLHERLTSERVAWGQGA